MRVEAKKTFIEVKEPPAKCVAEKQHDGGMILHYYCDPATTGRLQRKAGSRDLATFCYTEILRPAVEGAAY